MLFWDFETHRKAFLEFSITLKKLLYISMLIYRFRNICLFTLYIFIGSEFLKILKKIFKNGMLVIKNYIFKFFSKFRKSIYFPDFETYRKVFLEFQWLARGYYIFSMLFNWFRNIYLFLHCTFIYDLNFWRFLR